MPPMLCPMRTIFVYSESVGKCPLLATLAYVAFSYGRTVAYVLYQRSGKIENVHGTFG